MLALVDVTPWHWAGFIAFVLVFLALDLGVFHRHSHEVKFREAVAWTSLWCVLALGFAGLLVPTRGPDEATEFLTGYVIELSLSMDNVFIIALIFSYFKVPRNLQHRVLFWGIIGALVMRGLMIGGGAVLIRQFHWILYVLGAILIYSGVKMLLRQEDSVHPEKNPVIRAAQKLYPVTHEFDGQNFFTVVQGKKAITPLMLVLLMVETTDLVFALDFIPAIFAVTQNAFIVFTSNIFAILGLRSLYFVLAGAIQYFRYLKIGLSFVLIFIGGKMLAEIFHFRVPTGLSLLIVLCIIVIAIVASWIGTRRSPKGPLP